MVRKAFEGVKVADFTWAGAGPITTGYLAHHGAIVVKVESSTRPDNTRTHPPQKDGKWGINRSLLFVAENANKFSLTINLNHPRGIDVAKKLVAWADIFAESFLPGTVERWGLSYEELKSINPSIIMFRSSGQGQTGPHARVPSLGITLQSLSGFAYLTGWPDRDPVQPWGAYTDFIAPPLGAAMLIAALDYCAKTGQGQYLDLSQYETGIHFLAPAFLDYFANGQCANRMGNSCLYAVPHGAYRCMGDDRWCAIAVFNDKEWRAFCKVVGDPRLTEDLRFATILGRKKNEVELDRLVEEWTINFTAEQVMTLMQECGISAGVVENAEDLVQDPQLRDRSLWWQLDHQEMGRVPHRGPAFKLSKTPCELNMPAPCLGEHTEYVCREFLGISDEEFIDLVNAGALE